MNKKKRVCDRCGSAIPTGIGAYNLTSLGFGRKDDGKDKWGCDSCYENFYRHQPEVAAAKKILKTTFNFP